MEFFEHSIPMEQPNTKCKIGRLSGVTAHPGSSCCRIQSSDLVLRQEKKPPPHQVTASVGESALSKAESQRKPFRQSIAIARRQHLRGHKLLHHSGRRGRDNQISLSSTVVI